MITYMGYKIFESLAVPEFKEVRGNEQKWAHRVMYQRGRRFKVKRERVVIIVGDSMHAHPNTWKLIKTSDSHARHWSIS